MIPKQLEKRLNIPAAKIALFKDEKLTQAIRAVGSATLTKIGLKNGDMLHVGNQDVELASVKEAKQAATEAAAKVEKEEKKGADTEMIDTSSKKEPTPSMGATTKKPMTDEEYQKSKCRHGPN